MRVLCAVILCAMAGVAGADSRTKISASVAANAGIDPRVKDARAAFLKEAFARALPDTTHAHHVDISISSLAVVIGDQHVSVSASVQIAVADDTGTLVSVMSGGARVEVPNSAYRAFKLPAMEQDALRGAIENLAPRVAALLVRDSVSDAYTTADREFLLQLTEMTRARRLSLPTPAF